MEVLETHIVGNGIKKIFFVINKLDTFEDNIDEVSEDVKGTLSQKLGYEVSIFPVSALNYIDGISTNNPDLLEKSKMPVFLKELGGYLSSSDRLTASISIWTHQLNKLANQLNLLLDLRVASLKFPEEVFAEKKAELEKQLKNIEHNSIELQNDVRKEILRIKNKLNTSLEHLIEQMVDSIDTLDSRSISNEKLAMKNIEFSLRNRFASWKSTNEPIIKKYLESLQNEIAERLSLDVGNMSNAIQNYLGNITPEQIALVSKKEAKDDTSTSDIQKTAKALTLAGPIAATIMMLGGIPMAPLAYLIAPIGMSYLNKKREREFEQTKLQIKSALRENSERFRNEVLSGIESVSSALTKFIDESVKERSISVRNYLEQLEQDRHLKRSEIAAQITKLQKCKESLASI